MKNSYRPHPLLDMVYQDSQYLMTTSPASKHCKWLGVQSKDQHALKYPRPLSIQSAKVKETLVTCK